jgi:hypothetical protein
MDKGNSRRTTAVILDLSVRSVDRLRKKGELRFVQTSERRVACFDSEIERFKQRKLQAQEDAR